MPVDAPLILLQPPRLAEQLQAGRPVILVDTRPTEAYELDHLPAAVSLPQTYDLLIENTTAGGLTRLRHSFAELFSQAGITREELVVFYEDGTGMRAARAWWLAHYLGHPQAAILYGGISAWRVAGLPVSSEAESPTPARFIPQARESAVAGVEYVASRLGDEDFRLLDVRSEAEYTGAYTSFCCPRPGRIPGAKWLEWTRLLDRQRRFQNPRRLRALLETHGISKDKEIVTYCHRGARAANTYLALYLLGYPSVRNYIGSWHEWSSRPDLPVESG